jgi:hypothetical protein
MAAPLVISSFPRCDEAVRHAAGIDKGTHDRPG